MLPIAPSSYYAAKTRPPRPVGRPRDFLIGYTSFPTPQTEF